MKKDVQSNSLNYRLFFKKAKRYKSVAEMTEAIVQYFEVAASNNLPFTVQGLALSLGFNSRQSLLNYKGYTDEAGKAYKDIIDKAKLIIEEDKVRKALQGKYNNAFAIFDLVNNHNHENKMKQENKNSIDFTHPVQFIIEASENMPILPQSEKEAEALHKINKSL